MATSYNDVYALNRIIKNDPRLANINDYELNCLQFKYLQFSISYFLYDCLKDLTDRTDPQTSLYTFIGTGSDNEFLLSPAPATGSMFVVYVIVGDEQTLISDNTFNSSTNIITLSVTPALNSTVRIYSYTYGEFEEDLNDREKNILAEGMSVPYKEESAADQNAMKYIVTGKSLRFFSQANHIQTMVGNVNNQMYNTLNSLISEYTYKSSTDNYAGLAGRGSAV